MPGFIQRLFARKPGDRQPLVLAVTADLCFYSGVLNAACSARWQTEWARTLNRAAEICRLKAPPIVIYDSNLPGTEWDRAFDQLSAVPNRPRILLAAQGVDEELWRNVLRHHGYDVVERKASSEQLGRAFRFAWLSLPASADALPIDHRGRLR